jgi:hypothetical protein
MSEQDERLGPPQDREQARIESEAVARQPGGAPGTVRTGAPSAHAGAEDSAEPTPETPAADAEEG